MGNVPRAGAGRSAPRNQRSKVRKSSNWGGKRERAGMKAGARRLATNQEKLDLAKEAKQYARAAINTLVSIMGNEESSDNARIGAALALLDRGYGRPVQEQRHTGKEGGPVMVRIDEERLKRLPTATVEAIYEMMSLFATGNLDQVLGANKDDADADEYARTLQ